MIKCLYKISYIISAIVICCAFTGMTDNEIPDFTVQKASLDKNGNITITIVLAKKLGGKKKNNLKVNVFQKNLAGKQLCALTPKFSGNKVLKAIVPPCKPREIKLNKTEARQKYKVEIILKTNNEESKPESAGVVTVDLEKFYPQIFEETQVVKKEQSKNIQKEQGTSITSNPNTANSDNDGKSEKVQALTLQELNINGCKYLKIEIPSSSELNKQDIKLSQHYSDKNKLSKENISDQNKRINKKDNSYIIYFIPNKNTGLSMKFTIDVKGKKYNAENKVINAKDFTDRDECFAKLDSSFALAQQPNLIPHIGFNFKSLSIPILALSIIGVALYTIMQYRQRKRGGAKPLHKEPEETVLLIKNSEEEIKFFEPEAPGSSSYVNSIESSNYTKLADLETYYTDTAIANVFIEKGAAKEIFDFVWQSVQIKPSPEVGGFLMGKIQSSAQRQGLYDVYINAFLKDIAPDFQNNVNISFSDAIASDELDYIDTHQGEEKVGWLHTHPGHGVFLSPTDIGSHFRAFPRATQMAIVIESYDNFKTGIFSYRRGAKELNNISDKSTTIEYKSWKEFI